MRRVFSAILLACFGCLVAHAVPLNQEPGPPTSEELAAGKALAERLRSEEPEENSQVHGTLIIKSNGVTSEIPVVCRVSLSSSNWETDYETSATAKSGAERLEVIHTTNGPNQYLYAWSASPSGMLPKPVPVPFGDASTPLAGSDFSLADLGLEFLHWPVQRQLKGEMRLGQPCYVLESSGPPSGGIVRIKSDIDKESGGLLVAEAYDAKGHIIKEFSLHGSSFKKVNGRWRLEKMEIINHKTGSRTVLKFDMDK